MSHESPSGETTFGYLSSVRSPEHGYFGGYLILGAFGRPLEFHCTSPVRPSRAQEILYGPTLHLYLVGEQIGGALLQAAKLTPRLILTDQAAMLAARPPANVPMALLLARPGDTRPSQKNGGETVIASSDGNAATISPTFYGRFIAAGYELQTPVSFEHEQDAIVELLTLLSPHVDLAEPFGRIDEAIREAQRLGGRTSESYGEAA